MASRQLACRRKNLRESPTTVKGNAPIPLDRDLSKVPGLLPEQRGNSREFDRYLLRKPIKYHLRAQIGEASALAWILVDGRARIGASQQAICHANPYNACVCQRSESANAWATGSCTVLQRCFPRPTRVRPDKCSIILCCERLLCRGQRYAAGRNPGPTAYHGLMEREEAFHPTENRVTTTRTDNIDGISRIHTSIGWHARMARQLAYQLERCALGLCNFQSLLESMPSWV